MLRHAVNSTVARRGRPGSPEHTLLRQEQVRQGALLRGPFAQAGPDSALPADGAPVALAAAEEARAAWEAGLSGVRVPQAVGEELARAYHPGVTDAALRTLLAKLYQGGARYNHLLWNFAGLAELPWIRAVAGPPAPGPGPLGPALRGLAALAMAPSAGSGTGAGPGTGSFSDPGRSLVLGLTELARAAGVTVSFAVEPFTESYSGRVNAQVLPAARVAAGLLRGTPYERYYGIDFAAVGDMADADDREAFARLCSVRAGHPSPGVLFRDPRGSSEVAGNPAVIEQVRILTAFNLAALVVQTGVDPRPDPRELARAAFTAMRRRAATPGTTARACRHLLFHLSLCDADQRAAVLDGMASEAARLPARTAGRLVPLIADVRRACAP